MEDKHYVMMKIYEKEKVLRKWLRCWK
jgi:hypothetical protein